MLQLVDNKMSTETSKVYKTISETVALLLFTKILKTFGVNLCLGITLEETLSYNFCCLAAP